MPQPPGPLPGSEKPPAPLTLPEEDILLICNGYAPPVSWLYSPDEDAWRPAQKVHGEQVAARLLMAPDQPGRFPPDGQGYLIRERLRIPDLDLWQARLWLAGLGQAIRYGRGVPILLTDSLQAAQKPDDLLILYPFGSYGQEQFPGSYLLSVESCLAEACGLSERPGTITWSPDGRRSLIAAVDIDGRPFIYLGDESGQPQAVWAQGYSPFWLDNDTFAYIQQEGNGPMETAGSALIQVTGDPPSGIDLRHSRVVIQASSLGNALTNEGPPPDLTITLAAADPGQNGLWYIVASGNDDDGRENDYLFAVEGRSGINSLVVDLGDQQIAAPLYLNETGDTLSFLTFQRGSTTSGGWQLWVVDLKTPTGPQVIRTYQSESGYYDWSADGQWLLIAEDNLLRLTAPAYDYERRVTHNLGCHTSGWQAAAGFLD
jgi:hypothetical protein